MANDREAPERIWATMNGMSTRLPDMKRQWIGGWSEDKDRPHAVEYVRADLCASPLPPPGSAGEQLAAVQATIANMALLPHDHDCYLRPSLAERALSVLSEITASPKIISGPEAITLTWVVGGGKIYLTISEDDLDIMMIAEGRRTDARATLPPPAFVGVDLAKGPDQTARWLVLPEEGSAGEAEMVERGAAALGRDMRTARAIATTVLRAAFGGSGAAGEESGE